MENSKKHMNTRSTVKLTAPLIGLIGWSLCMATGQATVLLDDTFDGPAGSPPNPLIWNAGNEARLDGDGNLQLGPNPLAGSNLVDSIDTSFNPGSDEIIVRFDITDFGNDSWYKYMGLVNTSSPVSYIYFRTDALYPSTTRTLSVSNGTTIVNKTSAEWDTFASGVVSISWTSSAIEFWMGDVDTGTLMATFTSADLTLPTVPMGVRMNNYSSGDPSIAEYIGQVTVSTTAVPEPSAWGLLALGGVIVTTFRFRRTRFCEEAVR